MYIKGFVKIKKNRGVNMILFDLFTGYFWLFVFIWQLKIVKIKQSNSVMNY